MGVCGVFVAVGEGVFVGVGVAVVVGVFVTVDVLVGVGVSVEVGVAVGVGVDVAVGVWVGVGVGVGVTQKPLRQIPLPLSSGQSSPSGKFSFFLKLFVPLTGICASTVPIDLKSPPTALQSISKG